MSREAISLTGVILFSGRLPVNRQVTINEIAGTKQVFEFEEEVTYVVVDETRLIRSLTVEGADHDRFSTSTDHHSFRTPMTSFVDLAKDAAESMVGKHPDETIKLMFSFKGRYFELIEAANWYVKNAKPIPHDWVIDDRGMGHVDFFGLAPFDPEWPSKIADIDYRYDVHRAGSHESFRNFEIFNSSWSREDARKNLEATIGELHAAGFGSEETERLRGAMFPLYDQLG